MILGESGSNPSRRSYPSVQFSNFGCDIRSDLYSAATNSNDSHSLAIKFQCGVVICGMTQFAFEIVEALNIRPFPVAMKL